MKAMIITTEHVSNDYLEDIKIRTIKALTEMDFEIEVSELESMNFNLAISMNDYVGVPASRISEAQMQAYPSSYSEDILREMDKIKKSSVLIVITKLSYGLFPAILLGWIQRVFVLKFAVFSQDQILHHKKILFFVDNTSETNPKSSEALMFSMIFHNFSSIGMICLDPFILPESRDASEFFNKLKVFNNWSIVAPPN